MTTSPGPADDPAPPPRIPPPIAPQPGSLCINCKYPLHGVPHQMRCPECGTPILDPELDNPEFLKFADTNYLRTLRSGIRIVLIAHAIQIFLGIVNIGIGLVRMMIHISQQTPANQLPPHTMPVTTPLDLVLAVAGACVMLFVLVGWWRITTPDPSRQNSDHKTNHRAAARIWTTIFIVYWIASSAFAYVIMFMNQSAPTMSLLYVLLVSVPGFIAFILAVPLYIYIMLYLQWLAARVPDPSSFKLAKILVWLAPVLVTVGYCIAGLGPIAAFILSLILLFKLHKGISALVEAREPSDATYPI